MISLEDYKRSKTVEGLVQKLFESRQIAHNYHLKTKSYSTHKALQNYYEGILVFTDEFVETYQGQYGILNGYEKLSLDAKNSESIEDYMDDTVKIFVLSKDSLNKKDTHLVNIIDEIIALTYKTIYKLKNLK
jgi:hypothetical protein